MAHDESELRSVRDAALFSVKGAINAVGAHSCRHKAQAYAEGAIKGAVEELRSLAGEKKAFEYVMSLADGLVREPAGEPGSKLWTPNKPDSK
mgnify:CR=1 FL=1